MKRVLYNTCLVDPWLTVAKKLKTRDNWVPVYWVGFNYDSSKSLIAKNFPETIYHSYFDAWHGVFPDEVEEKYVNYYSEIDFLLTNAVNELQAFSMMNRLDYDRHSFNVMEREFHYLNLIKHWLCCIDLYKPDIVISGNNPHRVYDYALYLVCKYLNIPFLIFQYSMVAGRIYATDGIYSINGKFKIDYESIYNEGKISYDSIAEDIRLNYEKTISDYSVAAPPYMKTNFLEDKKNSNWFFLVRRYFQRKNVDIGKSNSINSGTIYKNSKYPLNKTKFSLFEFGLMRYKAFKYNKMLNDIYISLTEKPVIGEKYILFPLHYQPEETTSPCGGMFVNQWLCVETILANTPSDVMVYVKEHPHQFLSQNQGMTSRLPEFYYNLKKNPRVRLMPFDVNSYSLIKDAIAVSTVTGTVGWEALVQKKPVIIFGTIWYEECAGVLKIQSSEDASKIKEFIDNFTYSESRIIAYLQAVSNNSIKAYHYRGYKDASGLDEDACSENIIYEIHKTLKD